MFCTAATPWLLVAALHGVSPPKGARYTFAELTRIRPLPPPPPSGPLAHAAGGGGLQNVNWTGRDWTESRNLPAWPFHMGYLTAVQM